MVVILVPVRSRWSRSASSRVVHGASSSCISIPLTVSRIGIFSGAGMVGRGAVSVCVIYISASVEEIPKPTGNNRVTIPRTNRGATDGRGRGSESETDRYLQLDIKAHGSKKASRPSELTRSGTAAHVRERFPRAEIALRGWHPDTSRAGHPAAVAPAGRR